MEATKSEYARQMTQAWAEPDVDAARALDELFAAIEEMVSGPEADASCAIVLAAYRLGRAS